MKTTTITMQLETPDNMPVHEMAGLVIKFSHCANLMLPKGSKARILQVKKQGEREAT